MLLGFETENSYAASGALLVYAVYRSRDAKRGPSGFEMWGQIERFARRAAKRAENVSEFLDKFKKQMACATIDPRFCNSDSVKTNAIVLDNGCIIEKGETSGTRDFMLSIIELDLEEQRKIIEILNEQTQRIILLVRDRLEREKEMNGYDSFDNFEEDIK
jgi:hypothetical protein